MSFSGAREPSPSEGEVQEEAEALTRPGTMIGASPLAAGRTSNGDMTPEIEGGQESGDESGAGGSARRRAKRPRSAQPAARAQAAQAAMQNRIPPAARSLRSVLKVYCTKVSPNFAQPWKMRSQHTSSGSAFVIESRRRLILTNAHVVRHATSIRVRRPGNATKWKATLVCYGRDCDLALLTVQEDAFWEDPFVDLQMVDEPQLQDTTLVAGYPTGGDQLSITKGIVSRVTMARYTGACSMLAIQIDAAINPGNSGGPAFSDLPKGEVVGVAFSHIKGASNVGYVIPRCVVQHFLDEFNQHGVFRGVPLIAFECQRLENDSVRKWLGMPDDSTGVMVRKLVPLVQASQILRVKDVILSWGGVPVANDGTIELPGRPDERVDFTHLVLSSHLGDEVDVEVWRSEHVAGCEPGRQGQGGQRLTLRVPTERWFPLVPVVEGDDCEPTYFIIAGLVFVPLSWPFLRDAYSTKHKPAPPPLMTLSADYPEGEQVLVLQKVLSGDTNYGYNVTDAHLQRLNGVKVLNMHHLVSLVESCEEPFLEFELDRGCTVVLDTQQARAATPLILSQHNIASDRSPNLVRGASFGPWPGMGPPQAPKAPPRAADDASVHAANGDEVIPRDHPADVAGGLMDAAEGGANVEATFHGGHRWN